ncbi:MAG TPA: GAF domain-containing protein, partial [Polyangiaceae bacterium]|nr:GAF domain-containing protein [Polyangiaceae bacterium]
MSSILERLSRVVESHVPLQVLDAASKTIAAEVDADSCSIFLMEPTSPGLHLRSGFGHLALTDALKAAVLTVAGQALVTTRAVFIAGPPHSLLAVPMMLRGRPIGAIVAQAQDHSFSGEHERTLSVIAAHMVGVVESAR